MNRVRARTLVFCLVLGWAPSALAQAAWSPQGRSVERSSTSRTDLAVRFTLRPGEDPVGAALGCLRVARASYPGVTWVDCLAYESPSFARLSGRVRPCYHTIARWFAADEGMIRLYFAADDRGYPASCPAPRP